MVDKIRQSPLLLRLVEIAPAWLATELLVRITGTDAQFRMVDFRLMFVVLIGTVYGLQCRCAVCCAGICFSDSGLSAAEYHSDAAVL